MIKSVYATNREVIEAISQLYGTIEADVTYSSGKFWQGVSYLPRWKSDIHPQGEGVVWANATHLPIADNTWQSIMFDPPFLTDHGKNSIIGKRFSSYPTIELLWDFYRLALIELYRVTKPNGFLIFKCQDTTYFHRQYFSHVYVMNTAIDTGWYVRDLFILTAKHRMMPHNLKNQEHARKYHSYFLVLQKSAKVKWQWNIK